MCVCIVIFIFIVYIFEIISDLWIKWLNYITLHLKSISQVFGFLEAHANNYILRSFKFNVKSKFECKQLLWNFARNNCTDFPSFRIRFGIPVLPTLPDIKSCFFKTYGFITYSHQNLYLMKKCLRFCCFASLACTDVIPSLFFFLICIHLVVLILPHNVPKK